MSCSLYLAESFLFKCVPLVSVFLKVSAKAWWDLLMRNNKTSSYLTSRMGLLGNSKKELQFRMCSLGWTTSKSRERSRGTFFYRGEGGLGGAVINSPLEETGSSKYCGFSLAEMWQSLLPSSCWVVKWLPSSCWRSSWHRVIGHENTPFWPLDSILNEVSVHFRRFIFSF